MHGLFLAALISECLCINANLRRLSAATDRLNAHRKKQRWVKVAYVRLPVTAQGKTTASSIESDAIERLRSRGVPLWSTYDEVHRLRRNSQ